MAVNWNLGLAPNIVGNALEAYDAGRKERRTEASQKALGGIISGFGGGTFGADGKPVTHPDRQQDWGALLPQDRATALQLQNQQRQQAEAQQKQHDTQTERLARLLDHATDETTYQQSLAAAKQLGIDTSGAPPSFDPNWVNQQKVVLQAFGKDGQEQISGLKRELLEAGYKEGTPEFQQAMATALRGKYAPQYTDAEGNLRQSQLPPLPQIGGQPVQSAPMPQAQAPQNTPSGSPLTPPAQQQGTPPRPQGMTDNDLMAQAYEAVKNGASYDQVFSRLRAWGVNP